MQDLPGKGRILKMNSKQNGTIQIDVDEIWVLLSVLGYAQEDSDNVYFSSISRMLDLFDFYNFKVTFFIVGKDARITSKKKILKKIIEKGHELANHSLSHLKGLAAYPYKKKEKEIIEADKILSDIAGKKICGFRAPGYNVDEEILDILEENGYLYDSSVFPSFLCSLFRLAPYNNVLGSSYGKFQNGMAPLSVYRPLKGKMWKQGNRNLFEVPVIMMPLFRIPYHMSFVFASHKRLFDAGFFLTRKFGSVFNYVLHGIELVDEFNDSRFPQQFKVNVPIGKRLKIYKDIFYNTSKYYNIITSENLVRNFE